MRLWPKSPRATLVVATAVAIILTFALKLGLGLMTSDAIYAVTGLLVLWYAVEARAMRREMVRQNQLAVQPLLITTVRRPEKELELVVRNIGKGAALEVAIEDIEFVLEPLPGQETRKHLGKFSVIDVIEAGAEVTADVRYVTRDAGGEGTSHWSLAANLDPKHARQDLPVIIRYRDILGGAHRSEMSMGKSGIRLVRHS
jgi:hypothetical protein